MSMTLEQAIEHAEDTAKSAIGCECRDEHRQLAEWLKELKAVKDIIKQHDEDSMPEDFWYIDKIREAVQE